MNIGFSPGILEGQIVAALVHLRVKTGDLNQSKDQTKTDGFANLMLNGLLQVGLLREHASHA
jgi:hypothetical protein